MNEKVIERCYFCGRYFRVGAMSPEEVWKVGTQRVWVCRRCIEAIDSTEGLTPTSGETN